MPVTIRDVAERAGTSVAAVSAVISANRSHNIRIGHDTRERIQEAAGHLGYRPNPLAKSLVTGKSGGHWEKVSQNDRDYQIKTFGSEHTAKMLIAPPPGASGAGPGAGPVGVPTAPGGLPKGQ